MEKFEHMNYRSIKGDPKKFSIGQLDKFPGDPFLHAFYQSSFTGIGLD